MRPLVLSQYFLCFVPDWLLVKSKTECDGSEKKISTGISIRDCAAACKALSSMFAFGTNDYGNARCTNSNSKCQCLCETSASSDGTCKEVRHTGYRLYKYGSGDKGNVATKEKPNWDL
mgnify:CR=1 FL=1